MNDVGYYVILGTFGFVAFKILNTNKESQAKIMDTVGKRGDINISIDTSERAAKYVSPDNANVEEKKVEPPKQEKRILVAEDYGEEIYYDKDIGFVPKNVYRKIDPLDKKLTPEDIIRIEQERKALEEELEDEKSWIAWNKRFRWGPQPTRNPGRKFVDSKISYVDFLEIDRARKEQELQDIESKKWFFKKPVDMSDLDDDDTPTPSATPTAPPKQILKDEL